MRWARRVAQGGRTRIHLVSVLAALGAFTAVALVPATSGAAGYTWRGLRSVLHTTAKTVTHPPARASDPTVMTNGQSFGGVAAVGALFVESSGKLGQHFCTASVVDSPHGDLAVTAAHCVTGVSSEIAFVPGYANGTEPYGIWQVTKVYTDQAWQSSQDPDDDVAFLQLSSASGAAESIEAITGAEQVATGAPARQLVQVIGYPDGADQPVSCLNWAKIFSPTQLEFDCGGYPNGTSGGPFLANVSASTGQGTVIGVIGGYEQGGDTPQVSYSAAFGPAVADLYQTAESSS
jgi:V8-like Glu-specific endopeptidase